MINGIFTRLSLKYRFHKVLTFSVGVGGAGLTEPRAALQPARQLEIQCSDVRVKLAQLTAEGPNGISEKKDNK